MKQHDINTCDKSRRIQRGNDTCGDKRVKALVLTGFGLNCDMETAYAFELAGAKADRVHINSLISGKVDLNDFHILAFGGGFSWGDDHGAGVIQSLKLKNHIGEKILSFVNQGKLVIGICNGFQTLVNLGLLPGIDRDYTTRSVALTWNDCGNFRNQWVDMIVNPDSPCVFTKGLVMQEMVTQTSYSQKPYKLELPVRHAQGKFVADPSVVEKLIANNQVVLRYATFKNKKSVINAKANADMVNINSEIEPAMQRFPMNPNGSVYDIAGICDSSGHIFGLMPHPEAYNHYTNHPDWTIKREKIKRVLHKSGSNESILLNEASENRSVTPGIQIFINGVNYMASTI
ncbi:MAG: phosphoribosylformylglycinamidine synthase subunit PurQ [Desulfamplus sp.]|nr:phosphoribosylformylglycinamidine synthase subunit PurQ [Desulfamplus sp.]